MAKAAGAPETLSSEMAKGPPALSPWVRYATSGRPWPMPEDLGSLLGSCVKTMEALAHGRRPRRADGRGGSLVILDPGLPTAVVPDLHARPGLLPRLLAWSPETEGEGKAEGGVVGGAGPKDGKGKEPESEGVKGQGQSLGEMLRGGRAQLLFLGDYPHSEDEGAQARWLAALAEFRRGFAPSPAMDAEMCRCLGLYACMCRLSLEYPDLVHFLKGNHDNIENGSGGGDHAFYKFAQEGDMVAAWLRTRAWDGKRLTQAIREFEAALPLAAMGPGFLASHAEPARAYTIQELVNARDYPRVVEGLCWTDNGQAKLGGVAAMLGDFFGKGAVDGAGAIYLSGHRPVDGSHALRQGGLLMQIHNPRRMQLAWLRPGRRGLPRVHRI